MSCWSTRAEFNLVIILFRSEFAADQLKSGGYSPSVRMAWDRSYLVPILAQDRSNIGQFWSPTQPTLVNMGLRNNPFGRSKPCSDHHFCSHRQGLWCADLLAMQLWLLAGTDLLGVKWWSGHVSGGSFYAIDFWHSVIFPIGLCVWSSGSRPLMICDWPQVQRYFIHLFCRHAGG